MTTSFHRRKGLAHQWIYVVVYSLELRDYFLSKSGASKNSQPTIHDEINSLIQKCIHSTFSFSSWIFPLSIVCCFSYPDEILKRLTKKLMKDEYQRVLFILKQANSVVGDELENLLVQLQVNSIETDSIKLVPVYSPLFECQEEGKETKLAAVYLTSLRRSVESIEKVKIFTESIRGQTILPLSDLPAIYQGITKNRLHYSSNCAFIYWPARCWIYLFVWRHWWLLLLPRVPGKNGERTFLLVLRCPDACNRIVVIVRHAPTYEHRSAFRVYSGRSLARHSHNPINIRCPSTDVIFLDADV